MRKFAAFGGVTVGNAITGMALSPSSKLTTLACKFVHQLARGFTEETMRLARISSAKLNSQLLLGLLAVALCSTTAGCGGLAHLLYFIKGHDIPAAYSGFEAKRVAIVVTTESSSYGPDSLAETIERYLQLKLATNVQDIEIVPDTEVKNWLDTNNSEGSGLLELGKGVNADLVLGVDVDNYKIRQGRTMYKGRADIEVNVVDVATGEKSFAFGPDHFAYPENGRPAMNTTDRQFQMFYLSWLTERIARNFYKHDGLTDYADDAAFGS